MRDTYAGYQIRVTTYSNGNFSGAWEESGKLSNLLDFHKEKYADEAAVMQRIKEHIDGINPLPTESH